MDDSNSTEENRPSINKEENHRDNDFCDEQDHKDGMTNSESSGSVHSSSRLDMAHARPDVSKVPNGKGPTEKPTGRRKRRRKNSGRVEKRRRSLPRRQAIRKTPKRKSTKKAKRARHLSVSTIFTRLSSASDAKSSGCLYCGHRCCRRRFKYEMRCALRRKKEKKRKIEGAKKKPRFKRTSIHNSGSQCIQAGSRSLMLSPLYIQTNSLPAEEVDQNGDGKHCEVTPEMIYESLRRLTMWKQNVGTSSIYNYIKRNYPVNNVQSELQQELREKLRIAAIVGIVTQLPNDCWCLSCTLQNRKLTQNHVTLFWQVYGDTLKPATKKGTDVINQKQSEERQTNTLRICDDYLDDLI